MNRRVLHIIVGSLIIQVVVFGIQTVFAAKGHGSYPYFGYVSVIGIAMVLVLSRRS